MNRIMEDVSKVRMYVGPSRIVSIHYTFCNRNYIHMYNVFSPINCL
jgi:hypothetical protein